MTLISNDFLDPSQSVPTLLGGQSRATGDIKFPIPTGVLADEYVPIALKRDGTLWAYTIQRFPPGPPFVGNRDRHSFKPFAVGYVELEGQVIVETRIVTDNFDRLKIGLPMRLVMEEFPGAEGDEVVTTYAFQPSVEMV